MNEIGVFLNRAQNTIPVTVRLSYLLIFFPRHALKAVIRL